MPRGGGRTSASGNNKHDETFVTWLQKIGSFKYENKSILGHYMNRHTIETWDSMLQYLRTHKANWWIFVRNLMGKDNARAARDRYVDRFVFICNEEASAPYIDALLGIEECQLNIRMGADKSKLVSCPGCKRRDVLIQSLRSQLGQDTDAPQEDDRLQLLRKEFVRKFVVDAASETRRTTVRGELETFLKQRIGEEQIIDSSLWADFCRYVTNVTDCSHSGFFRCRRRQQTLVTALNLANPRLCSRGEGRGQKRKGPSACAVPQ